MTKQVETNQADLATAPIARRAGATHDGGAMVWLLALALMVGVALIVSLIALITYHGTKTFWPRAIEHVVVASTAFDPPLDGSSEFLGIKVRDETYEPNYERAEGLQSLIDAGALSPTTLSDAGLLTRRLYLVGNRELDGVSFRWVDLHTIQDKLYPDDALLFERTDWGVFLGKPEAAVHQGERIDLSGADAADRINDLIRDARGRTREIERLEREQSAPINREIKSLALDRTRVELKRTDSAHSAAKPLPTWAWALALSLGIAGLAWVALSAWRRRLSDPPPEPRLFARFISVAAIALLFLCWLENPWANAAPNDAEIDQRLTEIDTRVQELREQGAAAEDEIAELRAADAAHRIIITELATGRFAPAEQSTPDVPMRVSQIVRVVPANTLSLAGKVGVYLSRWREFLTAQPRNANTEGGVLPIIIGTVTLTMLLTVFVVPLGVIAAIYLREYAKQGLLVSIIRIAVNNLAGVPSIVYGVFGLGFFSYTIGKYLDTGPASTATRPAWWLIFATGAIILALALSLAAGAGRADRSALARRAVPALWLAAGGLALWLIATTPYFSGFFRAQAELNSPTLGTGGILWASITLALLTLPVVIVATEEAISAVPRSMREGSFGAGASRWQTVRRIVLPGALPGIMTGAVLAIARGAGEVAPLMLVGVLFFAPELPVDGEFPYLHAERSFMHLGYHIYELGFKSADAEASRPLVWTTTLLLLSIVMALNLAAFILRARIRGRRSGAV